MRHGALLLLSLFAVLAPARPGLAQSADLLRAVEADVAVSSVYRDQSRQANRLVDGDLASAWNSRTGDLVGAWIEVRLPANATVTGIVLTAGFTARPNLFEGNHRVTRVRVSREGAEVAELPVDPSSRELQTLAVSGQGGVWRIEVTAVVPGTRTDWRELCISELRILGTAPGMAPDTRFPRIAVGALPAPRAAAAPPTDRAAVGRAHREVTAWLLREWTAYEDELYDENQDTGTPGPEPDEIVALRATRQRLLRRVFELVENVDAARADAVRGAIAREETYYRDSAPSREVDALAGAMAAVADWLDDDAARCRWARAHADLRLTRIEHQMRSRVYFAEVEGETLPAIESAISRLERLRRTFRANPRGAAAAFPALRAPSDAAQAADVTALHEQLDAVAARCAAP